MIRGLVLITALLLTGCAQIEYLNQQTQKPERRAKVYFPYKYVAATGDIEVDQKPVELVVKGLVEIGPPAVEAFTRAIDKRVPDKLD